VAQVHARMSFQRTCRELDEGDPAERVYERSPLRSCLLCIRVSIVRRGRQMCEAWVVTSPSIAATIVLQSLVLSVRCYLDHDKTLMLMTLRTAW